MQADAALGILSGLSQETRLTIFRLLVEVGHDGLAAGEIASRLDVPSTTLSFHLSHMSRVGLVLSERRGTSIRYTANFDAMNDLVGYLTANCCGGDMSACAPKRKASPRRRSASA
jgi:ArsR family transcriptional regulator, arsenate/arsenite/antimonite-responsive transcriptional repressor